MPDLKIVIFHEAHDGNYYPNERTYEPSDFGGAVPAIGDWIIDPMTRVGFHHNVASEQTLLEVLRHVFWPHASNTVMLIVSERSPYREEEVFIRQFVGDATIGEPDKN